MLRHLCLEKHLRKKPIMAKEKTVVIYQFLQELMLCTAFDNKDYCILHICVLPFTDQVNPG